MAHLTGDNDSNLLIGTEFDDLIEGFGGNDTLVGGDGENTLIGGAGNDIYDGSDPGDPDDEQFDVVIFQGEGGSQGVDINLALGAGTDTYGDTDTFIDIERVIGSAYGDSMVGSDAMDEFAGMAGDDTLDGGNGRDELLYHLEEFEGGVGGVTVNLATGTATDSFGNTDTISNFEIVRGTMSDDTITGDSGQNWLRGLAGNDVLNGGDGIDFADYRKDVNGGGGAVNINLATGIAIDGFGDHDTLISIENVIGTDFDDVITGDAGDNLLRGQGGEDELTGGDGNDSVDGGAGDDFLVGGEGNDVYDGGGHAGAFDTLAYTSWSTGITVTFDAGVENSGTVAKTGGQTDTFANIHSVRGTNQSDIFVGGTGTQRFAGYGGDDLFDGTIGLNEVDYQGEARAANLTGGLTINLAVGTVIDATGDTDTLIAIERARGTDGNDVLIGSSGDNRLRGGNGHDWLSGGGGNDDLRGEGGFDTVVYGGNSSDYVITYLGGTSYSVIDKFGGRDGADTVSDVEQFQFANGTYAAADLFRPTDLGISSAQIAENSASGAYVGTFFAADPNGDALTYTLLDNAGGRFAVQGSNLVVANGTLLDYEQAQGHLITVRVFDSSYNFVDRTLAVSLLDVARENVVGSATNDRIEGGTGHDRISGGYGNDILSGGLGNDILTGGKGRDVFVFDTKPHKTRNLDTIRDFNVRDDSIYLDNAVFKKLGKKGSPEKPSKISKKFFTIGEKAKDKNDYLIYSQKKGVLYYDADGSGKGKAVEIAKLNKKLKMTYADFFVV